MRYSVIASYKAARFMAAYLHTGNGDTHQWNCDIKYALPNVKGLEFKLRTMIQKNDVVQAIAGNTGTTASQGIGNDTSNKELRAEVNYLFKQC